MADTQPKEGDQVSWAWGSGKPEGQVTEAKEQGDVTMTTKNNNEVKKTGEPENPALHIERDGHNVVKKASEVEVEESANKKDDKPEEKKDDEKKDDEKKDDEKKDGEEKKENGNAETGEKRKAEETAEEKKDEEADAKKQKTDEEPKANGEAPKKKGRPAKKNGDAPKKETKKREPKRAATETGEPRRSGRNRS